MIETLEGSDFGNYGFDGKIKLECGCIVEVHVYLDDGPNCRCGGGCWNTPTAWDWENTSIVDACGNHSGAPNAD